MKRASGGALTALVWMIAVGCGASESNGQPATGPDAADPSKTEDGTKGDGGTTPLPPPPPPPPLVDGKPVVGIFVSSSKGDDTADATVNRPVKTLGRALAIALEKKDLSIIACTETFEEQVTLPAGDKGVTLLGNYDCQLEWKQVSARARIVSPASPAVRAEGVKMPTRMEGFEIIAPDQTGALADGAFAMSSYGMFVKDAVDLTLADLRIMAGKGQDGVDGVASTSVNGWTNPSLANGKSSDGPLKQSCVDLGGGIKSCNFSVSAGAVAGAKGGTGACQAGSAGGPGGVGGMGRASNNGSWVAGSWTASLARGNPEQATTVTAGRNAAGAMGARGSFGANGSWSMTEAGFVPGDGTPGGMGGGGQGGGGSDSPATHGTKTIPDGQGGTITLEFLPDDGVWRTGIGGGGGAGGCGGFPGTGGRGGGASLGLFVVNSAVKITNSVIESKTGGRGGIGDSGGNGTQGGIGATSGEAFAGNPGGAGGPGGKGGQSGHGSAGASIALAFHGTRPTTTNVELKFGNAGEGGAQVTDGSLTLPLVERVAKQEHSF